MIYLFDWGDTLMVNYPDEKGPMYRWGRVSLCPNADIMLEKISKRYPCYLVTNAEDSNREDIIKALERVGISQYFSGIFCFRDIGFRKPSQEYFVYILRTLDCRPEEVVMVGDNPETDYLWACENGAKAVLYDPGSIFRDKGFHTVSDLMELCL